jgi:hypothetical protein
MIGVRAGKWVPVKAADPVVDGVTKLTSPSMLRSYNHRSGQRGKYMTAISALHVGESGKYSELIRRPLPEGLSLVFTPSLAALLTRARQLNGAALTEDQVLRIRNGSMAIVVRHDDARAMEEQRGYADIDAADAWRSWLRLQEAQA